MEAKRGPMMDLGALQAGAKSLNNVEPPPESKAGAESKDAVEENEQLQTYLEELYVKNSGDLDAIFSELNEDPGKAKKYPPEDEKVFATKYRQGFYSYIKHENNAAEEK
ncbi:hypothetical protein TL16_g03841 [Triparma laevis f. inornata]|uniref:Uncharacterized protein n=2 Tax=Triparma laevis TaxID=1534972 RepID=A0A9W7F946_9STRA|nr:hypothetical protein TL16_g03841 [Triparma laevis f. inornata]GMI07975.1 hypothetical protein TrLO_g88 [Triparma laevis f. longispina]